MLFLIYGHNEGLKAISEYQQSIDLLFVFWFIVKL